MNLLLLYIAVRFKLFQGGEMIYRFQTWDRGLRCFTGSMRLEITGSTFSSRYGIGAELRYGLYKNVTADKGETTFHIYRL